MTTPIPCDHEGCNLPSARIINGALVIESQHYGKKHRCTISLQYLQNLLTNCDTDVILRAGSATRETEISQAPP